MCISQRWPRHSLHSDWRYINFFPVSLNNVPTGPRCPGFRRRSTILFCGNKVGLITDITKPFPPTPFRYETTLIQSFHNLLSFLSYKRSMDSVSYLWKFLGKLNDVPVSNLTPSLEGASAFSTAASPIAVVYSWWLKNAMVRNEWLVF